MYEWYKTNILVLKMSQNHLKVEMYSLSEMYSLNERCSASSYSPTDS